MGQYDGKSILVANVKFGCDPELFFEKDGQVIGSEKVVTEPIISDAYGCLDLKPLKEKNKRAFVNDGVQIELNPTANTCRANIGNEIAAAFRTLRQHLAQHEGVSASFKSVVEVSQEELDQLSDKAKALGCAPSRNHYDGVPKVSVDGSVYRKRSAGGHIHLGLNDPLTHHAKELVPLMDLIVGNTCVMIDRDPHAAERRLNYGRAGEYRLPKHGLEYRTLSNFWLRAYPLMGMVFGLTRLAASIYQTEVNKALTVYDPQGWPAATYLLGQVDPALVQKAINENDPILARKNYEPVRDFISNHMFYINSMALNKQTLDNFDFFLKMIAEKGIEFWFPQEPMDHWCGLKEGHGSGFETFISHQVSMVRNGIAIEAASL